MAKLADESDALDQMQNELIATDAAINEKQRAKRGGGKLSRSETVTVRLDPKLNYLCELAARAQRRTKSSFIEWAIENSLLSVGIPGERKNANGDLHTIAERNTELWDVDETDRLVSLAFWAPSLLTHEEQLIWKVISTSPFLWRGRYEDDADEEVWTWDSSKAYNLVMDRVRANWEHIKSVAEGQEPRDEYFALVPRLVKGKSLTAGSKRPAPSFDDDLDTDVPF